MNKFLEKAALLGTFAGAVTSTEGHRWGGAGSGFLGDTGGRIAAQALLKAAPGTPISNVVGAVGGGIAGHFYGKRAKRKDELHKQATFNSLIEDGVDFDTAVSLVINVF